MGSILQHEEGGEVNPLESKFSSLKKGVKKFQRYRNCKIGERYPGTVLKNLANQGGILSPDKPKEKCM